MHGDADPLVPHCESKLLYSALQKAGVQSEFILVPNGQHGPGLFIEAYFTKMVEFFNSVSNNSVVALKGEPNDNPVNVYSHPSDNSIIVQGFADIASMKYELLDLSGEVLAGNYFRNNRIDIAFLIEGIYLLRIPMVDGNIYIGKFIKI